MNEKYIKQKRPHKRGHKVTSLNIEFSQSETLKAENLNLSLLVRDFLDTFLKENYSDTYRKFKELENEEEEAS